MMKTYLNKLICVALFSFVLFSVFFSVIAAPSVTFAQATSTSRDPLGYTPLAPLYEGQGVETNLSNYLKNVFRVLLGIAAILAVAMIVFAGIQYATSSSEGAKTAAKKKIRDAIWGLVLAMASWLILNTINPDLLDFNLELEGIGGTSTVAPSPDDPAGCENCVAIPESIDVKDGACSGSDACKVDPSLSLRLNNLNQRLAQQNITWRVTEAWPPTVNHQNPCHQNGTCIDANFTGSSNVASNVRHFINAALDSGLTACYEVKTQEDKDRLVNEFGAPPSNVKVVTAITGNHFSVYNRRTSC